MNKQKHIIVVGGSLAGLMNAIPLKRLGHRVTILERSPVPLLHDQGAGVVAGGETLEWVQRHGRSKRTKDDISVLSQWRYYLDHKGNVVDRQNSHQRMTSWGMLYNIGRECFDGMQHARGGPDMNTVEGADCEKREAAYEYGRTVTAVKDLGDQVQVSFKQARQGDTGKEEGTLQGDFLVVADGPSSHLRKLLLGESTAQRTYAGYVAFRGTVPESALSDAAEDVFREKFSFFHGSNPNTQILAYTIPNAEGALERGKRLVNWVWYHNVTFDSREYNELMTDKEGKKHHFTLPAGGFMRPTVWEQQKQTAKSHLPPQFAELVFKTEEPFVQAITDLEPPNHQKEVGPLMNGKVVIVGDALAGFRPHTAASTSQAAFDALRLEEVFSGKLSWDDYQEVVFAFARNMQAHGVRLGDRSQFGRHPLAD
ncbi:hypothetical protein LTR70_008994 [Exophiala xenobiotica]|uniref:FAD-binding domain-containing protein n=1 Tax=Lithohypha guttulata TaxID=1690604 RepID=A0ABR0JYH7_9EURO|nr:hypothetical protein LTR24_008937 [Lithohypha guttulata]KAK5311149.1 hypothetical protein LTR70_008994 [Exophiala xenobiotica]